MPVANKKKPRKVRRAAPEEDLLGEDTPASKPILTSKEDARLTEAAKLVQEDFKTVRVTVSQMPSRRAVSESQKREASRVFEADTDSLSMSKILFWKGEPAVKRVRAYVAAIHRLYSNRDYTLPHPEPGVRLIRVEVIPSFDAKIFAAGDELMAAARALKAELPDIIQREAARKKRLFDIADYDFNPEQEFGLEVRYPPMETPSYLLQLSPRVAEEQRQRLREIYDREAEAQLNTLKAACQMAEEQATENVILFMDAMLERLEGIGENGKRKVFRDDSANKIFDDLEHVRVNLNRYGMAKEGPLNEALQRLQTLVKGHTRDTLPHALRQSAGYREEFHDRGTNIIQSLLSKAVSPQRRKILRQRFESEALKANA